VITSGEVSSWRRTGEGPSGVPVAPGPFASLTKADWHLLHATKLPHFKPTIPAHFAQDSGHGTTTVVGRRSHNSTTRAALPLKASVWTRHPFGIAIVASAGSRRNPIRRSTSASTAVSLTPEPCSSRTSTSRLVRTQHRSSQRRGTGTT
jgi:hypothetical protein